MLYTLTMKEQEENMTNKEAVKVVLDAARKLLGWDANGNQKLYDAVVRVEGIYAKMKEKH